LLSGVVLESTGTFIYFENYVRSSALPLSIYAFRTLAQQVLVFFHNAAILVVVMIALKVQPSSAAVLLVPLAIAAVVVNAFFLSLWIGPLSVRFRDIAPFTQSFIQIMLFLTPIFWDPATLPSRHAVVWNPFAYFIEIFRNPLLGRPIVPGSYLVVLGLTLVNVVVGVLVFSRTRGKIAYWVG
jgi:ABC-type polysaccharide/polyol phosphate export permease